ncbi:NAD(P)-dependent alcohol dehydrogenase [Actinomadura sp. 3N407]|uniref:NAD(P)-dependent alcohol dehydrogenase n=1 Tax=Actinomadura sp. 3N407 TaxID=3457423 RepID=UPI003FCE8503
MKAIIGDGYGPPGDLRLRDIDTPVPAAGQVLVRVAAAGVHVGDCFAVRGAPLPVRLGTGLRRPRYGPGHDLAGRVEAVGEGVERFRPGDEVFGTGDGTCAEYARTTQDRLALKPSGLTFEEAAATPTSAVTALRALREVGKLKPGQEILINGASGGIGTFAVQIAASLGARVTGVCGPANLDLVRSLGAHHVIDYTREDFTEGARRYDLILDNVENRSLADCRRVLAPSGTLLLNSGTGARGISMLIRLAKPLLLSPFTRQGLRRFVVSPKRHDLAALTELLESGKVKPVIERTYALPETPAALSHIEGGHARGKVVITM